MSTPYATYPVSTAQQTQYPNHYPNVPVQIQPTSTYYSPYNAPGTAAAGAPSLASLTIQTDTYRQTHPAPARPPSPPEPAITPDVATRAIRRVVENEAIKVGFASSDIQAVRRFELEVVACTLAIPLLHYIYIYLLNLLSVLVTEQLFERAHEYANLANRASVIPPDLLLAIADFGIEPKELYRLARKRRTSQTTGTTESTDMVVSPKFKPKKLVRSSTQKTHKVLSTHLYIYISRTKDFTNATHIVNLTFTIPRSPSLRRRIGSSNPPRQSPRSSSLSPTTPSQTYLPPNSRECYITFSPKLFSHTHDFQASPPKKAALPSLEKKLKTAGLVQESLKNLMLATEDSTGQEDAELLGHIVNWEMGLHSRKRWRLG